MLTSAIAGLGLGLSLIIAIGAQNLFVLRQGVRREYALTVAAVCAASDAVLIVLGVSGLGLVLHAAPWLIVVVRWAGAAFLFVYAVLAARRALRPTGAALPAVSADVPLVAATAARRAAEMPGSAASAGAGRPCVTPGGAHPSAGGGPASARARLAPVILTCLALTWLNPHVYLDTVFLLGTVASTHGDTRWAFAAGAVAASLIWFYGLAVGARVLGRWLATPRAWRMLDGVIAVVMLALAVSLILPR